MRVTVRVTVVGLINQKLSPSTVDAADPIGRGVAMLDIFGFEKLPTNSLEQLCINFTNERLHGHYLNCTARAERTLYQAEGLRVEMPNPETNEAIISLLDGDAVNSLSLN